MRPDYKNWMPKGMVLGFLAGAVVAVILALLFSCTPLLSAGTLKTTLTVIFILAAFALCAVTIWAYLMYRAFDYNGKRQMSRQIIEGIASYVYFPDAAKTDSSETKNLPAVAKILDVGCGSGALAIAVAKRNPTADVTGIDRWGKEYASFSKSLCEQNAKAEGVNNVSFRHGDATHLEFPDETFDAVTSNYVYHNIPTRDRQAILLETLRTLKKGGTFAIHDIFSRAKYGDMQAFVEKLRNMGYQKVELIDTTDGIFMSRSEAKWMALSGSALLTGTK